MPEMIHSDALDILARCEVDGTNVKLPPGQLDRDLYLAVNDVLERLGGKWKGGRIRAHQFLYDPTELLEGVVASGEMPPKNPLAFFPTPQPVVYALLELATNEWPRAYDSDHSPSLLEPSAGIGSLVIPFADDSAYNGMFHPTNIVAVEVDPFRAGILRAQAEKHGEAGAGAWYTCEGDFLDWAKQRQAAEEPEALFDLVVMNPPFTAEGDKLAWVTHVRTALDLVAPEGTLGSVVPASIQFSDDKRIKAMREIVARYGRIEDLPPQAFKESGTGVNTKLIAVTKPADLGEWAVAVAEIELAVGLVKPTKARRKTTA